MNRKEKFQRIATVNSRHFTFGDIVSGHIFCKLVHQTTSLPSGGRVSVSVLLPPCRSGVAAASVGAGAQTEPVAGGAASLPPTALEPGIFEPGALHCELHQLLGDVLEKVGGNVSVKLIHFFFKQTCPIGILKSVKVK